MMQRFLFVITVIVIFSTMNFACSKNTPPNPVIPAQSDSEFVDWGTYTLNVDIENESMKIDHDRTGSIHFDVTGYLGPPACGGYGCIAAYFAGYDSDEHMLYIEIGLSNPTSLDVSDVRLIFPTLDLPWDIRELRNPHSYTDMGGIDPLPFLAFEFQEADRILEGGETSSVYGKFYWPFGCPMSLTMQVTAWLWVNCRDPYQITDLRQNGALFETHGTSTISCSVLDYQDDVSSVTLYCAEMTGHAELMT